ncbi:TIR domain-containing protein [Sphingomonas lutea]|uniref:TIR domain-containing protein n=1 Tax=Sphingomonas lutea TaxID=1045317 RepID=A0A7G9SJ76_9SPHN|nr:TIR domain-containing protein [Sphingomonas lutea]QNN67901.1 TIR domain-containing protein [Sphingomonas lutea]
MADVFISYSRADQELARRAALALKRAGYSVWWDNDLPAHRAYTEEIEQQLREAKAVLVLWSAEAARSQWVRAEADLARNAGTLVQAQTDGTIPPLPFNQIQCADLKGWRGSAKHPGWTKLVASTGALVGGEALRAAPASAKSGFHWRRPWVAAAALLLLMAIGAAAYWMRGSADEGRPVVAVMPFQSLDKRDESLVAGIWEDTRQAIGRNPQLLVLGPNTLEQLAEKGGDAPNKAADYLVQASVRSVGDRIRVNTNLIRTADGAQLWSENFDRRLDDVFALQSEIAGEIEGRIRGRLAARGGKLPENIATSGEVYALYSDARAKIRKRNYVHYAEAAKQLEQVVRKDPNFAPGWATLAVARTLGAGVTAEGTAEAEARRAIALAPNLAAGHAARGFALGQGPAAEAALRRAIALDPNDIEAMNWLANSLGTSRREEKLQLYSKIVEIEPLWWPAILNMINLLVRDGNDRAVRAEVERVERLGDQFTSTLIQIRLAERTGDVSQIITIGLNQYRRASPDEKEMIGRALWPYLVKMDRFDLADRLVPMPPHAAEFIPPLRRYEPRAIDMIEERVTPRQFWTQGPLPVTASRVYLVNNQGPRLAKLYHAAAPNPDAFEKLVSPGRLIEIAPSLALALRSAGEDNDASEILKRAEAAVERSAEMSGEEQVNLARIYAAQGRKDEAIGQLSAAIRQNWLPTFTPVPTDIAIDPALGQLKGDPRFERLRQQVTAHLAKEKAELGPISLN